MPLSKIDSDSLNSPITAVNLAYTGTLTGSTGVVNFGSGQFYKDASGNVGIGKVPANKQLEIYAASSPAIRIQNSTTGTGVTDGFLIEQSGSDSLIVNYEAGATVFLNNGAERARIDSSGTLILNQGQIQFPATAVPSANVNTLDDYEEGTWTPNINGTVTGTFTSKTGSYVKIGKQVTLWFVVDGGTTGTGGATQYITGLPFTIGSMGNTSICGTMGVNGPANRILNLMMLTGNRNVFYVYIGGAQETTAITFASGSVTYWVD